MVNLFQGKTELPKHFLNNTNQRTVQSLFDTVFFYKS